MRHDQNFGEGIRPDGVIRININKPPWLIIEAAYTGEEHILTRGKEHLRKYQSYIEPKYSVLIGVGYLAVLDSDENIVETTPEDERKLSEIEDILTPPERLQEKKEEGELTERQTVGNVFSDTYYEIDLSELENALNEVDQAETTKEKGDTFEYFARVLFNSIDFLEVRDQALRTNTGEIDIVVEYTGSNELTIFDQWSRFILVECKNWADSVGVSQIRDFKGKMDKAQIDLGVIFARNGISGDEATDAVRLIHDCFQRDKCMILVIGDNEIEQLLDGRSFYELLDESIYQRRFDFD